MSKYSRLRVQIPDDTKPNRIARSVFRVKIKPYPINLNFLWDKIGPKLKHFLIYSEGGNWRDVEHVEYASLDIRGQTEITVKHRTKLCLHTELLATVISTILQ